MRARDPALFSEGSYEPIEVADDAVCAFVRRLDDRALLVAVSLYPWRGLPWRDGDLLLPMGLSWENLRPVVGEASADGSLAGMFRGLPIMVLATAPL